MENDQKQEKTSSDAAEYRIPAELLDGMTDAIRNAAEQILDEIVPLSVALAKARERAATA